MASESVEALENIADEDGSEDQEYADADNPSLESDSNGSNQSDLASDDDDEDDESDASAKNTDNPTSIEPPKMFSHEEAMDLISKCDYALNSAECDLDEARYLAEREGLSVDSSVLDPSFKDPVGIITGKIDTPNPNNNTAAAAAESDATTPVTKNNTTDNTGNMNVSNNPMRGKLSCFPLVLSTTGGHSNTDHVVQYTGDKTADRIAEFKRALRRRARASQPEQKGEDRWDQPRVSGVRRRRILRDKDCPSAPPEPPPSGYIIFVGQMTTKIRHDRPKVHHNQTLVMKEISKIWKYQMSEEDKQYYVEFAREAQEHYQTELREYRATGGYKSSGVFEKLDGGPWVRCAYHEKNALEREIENYPTVKFPPRPAEMEEEHQKAVEERKERRKKMMALYGYT